MISFNEVIEESDIDFHIQEQVGNYSGNLLIHGENLQVLSKLKKYYFSKIKCIYIDPPYNTCNNFEHFDDTMPHDVWLEMMKERLKVLWDFLSDDGTIWISIDDVECHYLKVLCDELWGRDKFITMIVRQKNDYPNNYKNRQIVHMQDYVLIYCKNMDHCTLNSISSSYMNGYALTEGSRKWIPKTLLTQGSEKSNNEFVYKIVTPSGKELFPPYGKQWTINQNEFKKKYKQKEIWFGEFENEYPCQKLYCDHTSLFPPTSLWTRDMVGTNQEARSEVAMYNSHELFYTPKPERFIELILSITTKEGDMVLDAFLGSGTTAVVATKMRRKWIGIEKGCQCVDFCLPRLKKVVEEQQASTDLCLNSQDKYGFVFLSDDT